MQVDAEELRRFEEDLADRLENTVRRRVVTYFTTMGIFVSGVLGFFGYNVIQSARIAAEQRGDALVRDVSTEVRAQVATLRSNARAEVDAFLGQWEARVYGALVDAQEATEEAQSASTRTFSQLEILERHLERREEKLLEAEDEAQKRSARLIQMQKAVSETQDEVAEDMERIRESLTTMKVEISAAQTELTTELEAQTEALRIRSSDQVQTSREGLSKLGSGLESLALQVEQLGAQLVAIQQRLGDAENRPEEELDPASALGVDQEELSRVRDFAQSQQIAIPDPVIEVLVPEDLELPIVYVQFSGLAREKIEEISNILRDIGYSVPGEERLAAAAGRHEVRFFWEKDRAAAELLAADTEQVLGDLGYQDVIQVRDFTNWSDGPKPKWKTVELWLEPVIQK